jgi:hypothetical protein
MSLAEEARASIHGSQTPSTNEFRIGFEDIHADTHRHLSRPWLVNQRPASSNYDVSPPGSDFAPDENGKDGLIKVASFFLSHSCDDLARLDSDVASVNSEEATPGVSRSSSCPNVMGSPTKLGPGASGEGLKEDVASPHQVHRSNVTEHEISSQQDHSVHTKSPEENIAGRRQTHVHSTVPVSHLGQVIKGLIHEIPGDIYQGLADNGPEEPLPERQKALCKLRGVPYVAGRSAYWACNRPILPPGKPLSTEPLSRIEELTPHIGCKFPVLGQPRFSLEPQFLPNKTVSHAVGNGVTLGGFTENEDHLMVKEAELALIILEEERHYYAGKEDEARKTAGRLRAFTCLDNSEDWRDIKDKQAEKEAEAHWDSRAKVFGAWREVWDRKIEQVKDFLEKFRLVGEPSEGQTALMPAGAAVAPQQATLDWA